MKFKFLLHIIFWGIISFAQTPVEAQPEEVYEEVEETMWVEDEEDFVDAYQPTDDQLSPRRLSSNFKEAYSSNDFDYTRTKVKESLWSKLERKILEFLSELFGQSNIKGLNDFTYWAIRIIAVGILGLVAYWLIKYVIGKDGNWFFGKKDKPILPEAHTIKENIHEIDLDELIAKYENEKNYRFATRYQYLKLLKVFNDKKLLTWDPDKTNLDYIREVGASPYQQEFKNLTLVFDYVWYGDFEINLEDYTKYKQAFHQLIQSCE